MKEKKYEYMISQYVDNELNNNDVDVLIEHVADCTECQELLNKYSNLKNSVSDFYSSLDYYSVNPAGIQKKKKTRNIISFATAAIVVFITFMIINLITPIKNNEINSGADKYNTVQIFNNNNWVKQISELQNSMDKLEEKIQARQL